MSDDTKQNNEQRSWPQVPAEFPPVMTSTEAAQYLRLDRTNHTPESAKRTLNYWREHGELKATKYARHVWFLRQELDNFLMIKTESHFPPLDKSKEETNTTE